MENFFLVAPKATVLFIELLLAKEGEAGGALESVVDLDAVCNGGPSNGRRYQEYY